MSQNSNIDDPFAFLDEQPDKQEPVKHTPESIRKRCQELLDDADGVIPGLRIIGLFSMTNPLFCQLSENEFCNHMLSYLSDECAAVARDTDSRRLDEELCPNCLHEEDIPTEEEMDIPESRSKDDEDEDF